MESNNILDRGLPIKAYPKKQKQQGIILLKIHIAECCKLNRDEEYMDEVVDAINDLCGEYGFKDIKKMFELYRDSLLNITPITNHIDRILFGQILQAYKKSDRNDYKTNRTFDSVEYKDKYQKDNEDIQVIIWFDWFLENRIVPIEMLWVYEWLIKNNENFTPKKIFIQRLEEKGVSDGLTLERSEEKTKLTLLKMYFERLEAKGKHIKDEL